MKFRNLPSWILTADLAWSVLAMAVALAVRYGVSPSASELHAATAQLPFLGASLVLWTLLSRVLPLDGFRGGWRFSAVVSQLLLSVGGLMLVLLSGGYLFRSYVSRLTLVSFGLLLLVGFTLLRVGACRLLRFRSQNGSASRTVIVGRGRLMWELARRIQRHPEMVCKVVGFLSPDDGTFDPEFFPAEGGATSSTRTLGVVDLLVTHRVDQLVIALPGCASPELLNLTARCRQLGIRVSLVPQLYELYLSRPTLVDLGGLPVLQLDDPCLAGSPSTWKRVLDLLLGIPLSLIATPLLVPSGLIVRYIKGKAFRWETRCGYHGKLFPMLRLNLDRAPKDASRFERALDKMSLTELPQLWNVLRGDMSLVGPRPESPDRARQYSEWQQQRLAAKPGITGLAQVHGLREQNSSEEKTRFDLQYLLHASPWTDLTLLLQTVWTLVMRSLSYEDSSEKSGPMSAATDLLGSHVEKEMLHDAYRS
jgi:lipopolysaccharide/colanic/teichoic acid biosynthesis glycosyltransferase